MYDADTGLGVQGDYEASLIPTVPGDYTFHLTGKIHDTAVDETATSSDSTFNAAGDPTDVQFPAKVPTATEITTRLDRLDARVAAVASAAPQQAGSTADAANAAAAAAQTTAGSAQSAAAAAQAAANQAHDAATAALVVAIGIGALGVILGAAGLFAATRRRPAGGA